MQYKGKNEILIWAVLSEPMVKFHNFASLGGYFLLFEPQKTKKIQKKFIRQFLILADFSQLVLEGYILYFGSPAIFHCLYGTKHQTNAITMWVQPLLTILAKKIKKITKGIKSLIQGGKKQGWLQPLNNLNFPAFFPKG